MVSLAGFDFLIIRVLTRNGLDVVLPCCLPSGNPTCLVMDFMVSGISNRDSPVSLSSLSMVTVLSRPGEMECYLAFPTPFCDCSAQTGASFPSPRACLARIDLVAGPSSTVLSPAQPSTGGKSRSVQASVYVGGTSGGDFSSPAMPRTPRKQHKKVCRLW